jgi:hypothetical protein
VEVLEDLTMCTGQKIGRICHNSKDPNLGHILSRDREYVFANRELFVGKRPISKDCRVIKQLRILHILLIIVLDLKQKRCQSWEL